MLVTLADQMMAQFYAWEQRGRGWHVFDIPVQLEVAFEPFFSRNRKKPDDSEAEEMIWAVPAIGNFPLHAFTISFPIGYKTPVAETEQFLLMLADCAYPVSFELIATAEHITMQFVCDAADVLHLKTLFAAYFPQGTFTELKDACFHILDNELYIVELGLSEECMRPLAMPSSFDLDPFKSLFSVLEQVQHGEGAVVQIMFKRTVNPWSESMLRAVTMPDGSPFFIDAPDMVPLAKQKVSAPLFAAVVRVLGSAATEQEAQRITARVGNALVHCSHGSGNKLILLSNDEYDDIKHLEDLLLRQTHRVGMLLNSKELATFVHYPSASVVSTKLVRDTKKTKAAPASTTRHGFELGLNEHQGVLVSVSQSNTHRLKHTHIIGATGTGKSTLLLTMIVQDIAAHSGVCVLDPHGDLIEKILTYIPDNRIKDVLIIDPADAEYPVGFNILSAHSPIEKEILSSDLVAAFRRLSTSWGDQMNSVFGNAILAFLESSKGGTLADLRRFLIDKGYRDSFLKSVSDPSIVYYWLREYPLLKSGSIGSILTRLDAFLRPKLIRNMVCQHKSIDFERLMESRKIILVKLSQGLIGAENSFLLGTFIVSKIQQAAMARQAKAHGDRKDCFLYIDEFQHFITPSMSAILSGARKYHLGLILAHQSMQQVTDAEIASSIIANAGTRICFRLGETDAKKLADGFSFFEVKDLQNLSTGEAIVRIERPEHDFSLTTIPLAVSLFPETLKEQVIACSRQQYATPKAEVEAYLSESMQILVPEELSAVQKPVPEKKLAKPAEKQQEIPALQQVPETITSVPQQSLSAKGVQGGKTEQSRHTYLKHLIKRMAEDRGFVATLEEATPDGKGKVDVGLTRNGKRIACEISVTTADVWEVHNAEKCLAAGYDTVIVCSTDKRHLEKIHKLILQQLDASVHDKVLTLNPEGLFLFLDQQIAQEAYSEERINGYRVTVEYKAVPEASAKQKREHIIKTLLDSIRKNKK